MTHGGRDGSVPSLAVAASAASQSGISHRERQSRFRPDRPHPLFYGFVKAAAEQAGE